MRNFVAPNPSRKMMRKKKMRKKKMMRMWCHVASSCAYAPSWRPFASFGVRKVAVRPPRRDVLPRVASPRLDSLSREEPLQIGEAASLLPPDRLGGSTSSNVRTHSCPSSPNAPVVGVRCPPGVLAEDVPLLPGLAPLRQPNDWPGNDTVDTVLSGSERIRC